MDHPSVLTAAPMHGVVPRASFPGPVACKEVVTAVYKNKSTVAEEDDIPSQFWKHVALQRYVLHQT